MFSLLSTLAEATTKMILKLLLLTFLGKVLGEVHNAATLRIVEKLKSPLIPKPPDCGIISQDFIAGGEESGLYEFLWTVSLRFKTYEKEAKSLKHIIFSRIIEEKIKYSCGGSLINDRYVLTAAHCVVGLSSKYSLHDLRIGEHNYDTDPDCDPDEPTDCLPAPIDMNVAEIIIHPEYNSDTINNHNDIALLRLAEKVVFTEDLKPVCLPLDPSLWKSDHTGKVFQVVGWGLMENGMQSSIKRKVKLPVVPHETCREIFGQHGRTVIDSQICAGIDGGKDSCRGGYYAIPLVENPLIGKPLIIFLKTKNH